MTPRGLQSGLLVALLFCSSTALCRSQLWQVHDGPPKEKDPFAPKKEEPLLEDNNVREMEAADEFFLQGQAALKKGQLEQAEGFFDRALMIRPKHRGAKEGIKFIMAQYAKLDAQTNVPNKKNDLLDRLTTDLEHQTTQGHWYQVRSTANKILAVAPSNPLAKQRLQQADKNIYANLLKRIDDKENAKDFSGAISAAHAAFEESGDHSLKKRISELQEKRRQSQLEQSNALYIQALTANQKGDRNAAVELGRQALTLNPDNLQARRMLERLGALK